MSVIVLYNLIQTSPLFNLIQAIVDRISMIKHLVFLILLCNAELLFSTTKNYYIIDGLHENDSVIQLWYTVLGLLDEYDKGLNAGFEIAFNQNGRYFNPQRGSNWWKYYFAFNTIGSPQNSATVRIPRYKRSIIQLNTLCTMPIERAHYLLQTYMLLEPTLQKRLHQIKKIYWPDNLPVIGVYYQKPLMPAVQPE